MAGRAQHHPLLARLPNRRARSLAKNLVDSTKDFVEHVGVREREVLMKRSPTAPPRPTQAELEILRVLWQLGPSSVREVQGTLPASRAAGYTTVLKLLQIMAGKGLVARDVRERTHVYRAALRQEQTQRQLIHDLVERAFDGS